MFINIFESITNCASLLILLKYPLVLVRQAGFAFSRQMHKSDNMLSMKEACNDEANHLNHISLSSSSLFRLIMCPGKREKMANCGTMDHRENIS